MAYDLLIRRIDDLWKAASKRAGKPISERQLCLRAEVGVKTLYSLRQGHAPKPDSLMRLADYFSVPRDYLLSAADEGLPVLGTRTQALQMTMVAVKGAVQAGVWREAVEWQPEDWRTMAVQVDNRWDPAIERYALLVLGNSMNNFYPDGSFVTVINFYELGRGPKPGERVVAVRRSASGEFEATLKEYQVDSKGRHVLWPRSDDPDYQAPFVLPENALMMGLGTERLPQVAAASHFPDDRADEIRVVSLVIGFYRQE